MTRFISVAALLLLCLAVWIVPASAQPGFYNPYFDLTVPTNGTGEGWTASDNAGGWQAASGNPAPCYYLNSVGGVTDPTISQTLTGFVPGIDYVLTGDHLNDWGAGDPAGTFVVYLDGTPILEAGRQGGGWMPFAVAFTATAVSHEISIAAEVGGSDFSYYIDNILIENQVAGDWTTFGAVKALYR